MSTPMHLARRAATPVAEADLLIALGSGATGEMYRGRRVADGWVVEPAPSFVLLPEVVMLLLPDDPFWRAWVDPTTCTDLVGRAADARFVSWRPGAAVTSLLPPLDVDPASIARLPEGYSSPGLDFAARFELTAVPGGMLTAVLVWRDGVLAGSAEEVPDDLADDRVIHIRSPYTTLLRYLTSEASIYSVLSTGSTMTGSPTLIQYFAGYVEGEAALETRSPGRERARGVIASFVDGPVVRG